MRVGTGPTAETDLCEGSALTTSILHLTPRPPALRDGPLAVVPGHLDGSLMVQPGIAHWISGIGWSVRTLVLPAA